MRTFEINGNVLHLIEHVSEMDTNIHFGGDYEEGWDFYCPEIPTESSASYSFKNELFCVIVRVDDETSNIYSSELGNLDAFFNSKLYKDNLKKVKANKFAVYDSEDLRVYEGTLQECSYFLFENRGEDLYIDFE